jgi:hypothetical protein
MQAAYCQAISRQSNTGRRKKGGGGGEREARGDVRKTGSVQCLDACSSDADRRKTRQGQSGRVVLFVQNTKPVQSTSAAAALEMTLLVGRTKPNLDVCRLPIFAVTNGIAADLVLPSTTTTYHLKQYTFTRQSGASLSIEPRRRRPRSPSCGQSSGRGHASAHRTKRRRYISHCTTSVSLTST